MTDYSDAEDMAYQRHQDRVAEDWDEHEPREPHHVEVFIPGAADDYGWQCFTCGDESDGYPSIADAEEAGDVHVEDQS